jgi:hypothetical protein
VHPGPEQYFLGIYCTKHDPFYGQRYWRDRLEGEIQFSHGRQTRAKQILQRVMEEDITRFTDGNGQRKYRCFHCEAIGETRESIRHHPGCDFYDIRRFMSED